MAFHQATLRLEEAPTSRCYLLTRPVLITSHVDGRKQYLTTRLWSSRLRWSSTPSRRSIFVTDATLSTPTHIVLRSQRRLRCIMELASPEVDGCWPRKVPACAFVLTRRTRAGLPTDLFESPEVSSVASTPLQSRSRGGSRYVLRSMERPGDVDVRSHDGSTWVPLSLFSPHPSQ
ncbi:hypothetical protein SDRG_14763 [Saprolegnia diclina VS20]|uniref:Uncharacterized protein n=1 Tax=Saprolegnia diclina (strain VS20) TaxID=1156394 RepID=T0PPR4_SAPDV|nr:hypothetical protein SDRG_14763 [Saprolegnia diclina VS20]EQC27439.1 hypothetical protein SDRG_14763 [Saprolegnia diclina VS20]|eukprot:XP_008619139.1 hypothetical protein SDRG_14763 [Saprolegnia diclina VS20]